MTISSVIIEAWGMKNGGKWEQWWERDIGERRESDKMEKVKGMRDEDTKRSYFPQH